MGFPISRATSSRRLPMYCWSAGLAQEASIVLWAYRARTSGGSPCVQSMRMRARRTGSWNRAIIRSTPPSWAQSGSCESSAFCPASYG
jgi:hypothetical protein